MIKVVLFDFYGVFLPDTYSVWLASNDLKREGIFADAINALDRGVCSEDEFLSTLSDAIGRTVQRGDIHGQAAIIDSNLVELVRTLRPNYTIGLFSNASVKLRSKLEDLSLTDFFDEIIISCEIGYAKPSDEAFQSALEKIGMPASEVIFIDDNPANIDAARRNGIAAIHYTSPTDLRGALQAHKVL